MKISIFSNIRAWETSDYSKMNWTLKLRDRFAPDLEINPRYRAHLEELQDQFQIMEKGHKRGKYETILKQELEQIKEMFSPENMQKRMHLI